MTRFVSVGRVGRPHGLDGSFVVEAASDDPARLAAGAIVYLGGQAATVVESKRAGGRPVVRLDRPALRGAALEVPVADLPALEEDEFYAFQLVGLTVEDDRGVTMGRVVEVAPGVANDVLELDSGLALPLVEDCVRSVDLLAGRIVVTSGLVES